MILLQGIHKGEKIGITYSLKHRMVMIGGKCKLSKHLHSIVYDFMRMSDDKLDERTGTRQRHRYRFYQKMTNDEFRLGLKRLNYRYSVMTTDSVAAFT